jgi:hypothetical protein
MITASNAMTRLKLLDLIQDNAELITLPDAVAILSGRLHRYNDYIKVVDAWNIFFQVLVDCNMPID